MPRAATWKSPGGFSFCALRRCAGLLRGDGFLRRCRLFSFDPGSPVAAFSTSPPPSRAISARSLLLTIERGFSIVTSFVDVYWSRCLMSSHDFPEASPPQPVRANQDPRSFQFFAVKRELEIAFSERRVHVRKYGRPRSLVPDHYSRARCATTVRFGWRFESKLECATSLHLWARDEIDGDRSAASNQATAFADAREYCEFSVPRA